MTRQRSDPASLGVHGLLLRGKLKLLPPLLQQLGYLRILGGDLRRPRIGPHDFIEGLQPERIGLAGLHVVVDAVEQAGDDRALGIYFR